MVSVMLFRVVLFTAVLLIGVEAGKLLGGGVGSMLLFECINGVPLTDGCLLINAGGSVFGRGGGGGSIGGTEGGGGGGVGGGGSNDDEIGGCI